MGMLAGAAIVFFAYIGFDSISTHAEEARNPARDVPIGIMTSLVLCTILYIAVAAVLTGMVPYRQNQYRRAGLGRLPAGRPAVGGIAGFRRGGRGDHVGAARHDAQPAANFSGHGPGRLAATEFFGAVHERFRTPWKSTILTGLFVATMGAFLPLRILAELVNIGTLLAFVIVCAAVMIMRRTHPEVHRPFRAPFGSIVPILGNLVLPAADVFPARRKLVCGLSIWLVIGLVIYFSYGIHHSRITLESREANAKVALGQK